MFRHWFELDILCRVGLTNYEGVIDMKKINYYSVFKEVLTLSTSIAIFVTAIMNLMIKYEIFKNLTLNYSDLENVNQVMEGQVFNT